ncbi:RNA methyltransferase [Aequorivita lipolytica]|uniref:RNA methyltransferase n=1 Tax=Aequorivita lipolytica TaxID=153267 RepID=A0A5C6YRV2_9FLAO|nr:RNA methyltransferase [Aequorivita lipolytica]TXD69746.1 RNA methyltransferase [Aequorivita lipolytica]SRX50445.1 23S rRNA (uridine(2479)-2'-O)-methyltransferase [Aequorivita lipolytica]
MVSKSQTKLITSLQQKKYRTQSGLFVAEGPKVISELLDGGFKFHSFFSTDTSEITAVNHFLVTETELKKISFLKTANTSLALFEIPKTKPLKDLGLILALDAVRDPGNLGTIIRLCDWFGVQQLICSQDTADCFNPKVVQATMGSLARVQVHYLSLSEYFEKTTLPIYGGFMEGENIYSAKLPKEGIMVMGNEANGISEEIIKTITHKITIPRFGKIQKTESLNVATATAILLSEFRRSTEM